QAGAVCIGFTDKEPVHYRGISLRGGGRVMQSLQDKHFTLPTAALVHMVQDARERTLALVADLEEAQFEVPLLALVNPLRWELGHVTFFYEAFVLQLLGQTKPLLVGAEDLYDSFKIDHDDRW